MTTSKTGNALFTLAGFKSQATQEYEVTGISPEQQRSYRFDKQR